VNLTRKISFVHGFILCLTLTAGLLIRLPYILHSHPFYNSDMAIIDLMALNFLKGHWAFYYWGQRYYGVLDSVLLMPFFKYFGMSLTVSQGLPCGVAIVFLAFFHFYVRRVSDVWTAHIATALLAVPGVAFIAAIQASYCYIFVFLFGIGHFLLADRVLRQPEDKKNAYALGILAGFSWYYFHAIAFFWLSHGISIWWGTRGPQDLVKMKSCCGRFSWRWFWRHVVRLDAVTVPNPLKKLLVLVNLANVVNTALAVFLWFHGDFIHLFERHTMKLFFSPTFAASVQMALGVGVVVFWRELLDQLKKAWDNKCCRRVILGFIIGYSPALMGMLAGVSPKSHGEFVSFPVIYQNFRIFFTQIIPYWFTPAGNPLLNALTIGLFSIGAVWGLWEIGRTSSHPLRPLCLLSAVNFILGMLTIELMDQYNSRYFLGLYVSVFFGTALVLRKVSRRSVLAAVGLLGLILANNSLANRSAAQASAGPDTSVLLAQALLNKGIQGGYADYWIAYRFTAASGEKVVIVPAGNNDRHRAFLDYVQALPHVVLLGRTLPANQAQMIVKGMSYKVMGQESLLGTPIIYLEKC
jgi:hypothetical protein